MTVEEMHAYAAENDCTFVAPSRPGLKTYLVTRGPVRVAFCTLGSGSLQVYLCEFFVYGLPGLTDRELALMQAVDDCLDPGKLAASLVKTTADKVAKAEREAASARLTAARVAAAMQLAGVVPVDVEPEPEKR